MMFVKYFLDQEDKKLKRQYMMNQQQQQSNEQSRTINSTSNSNSNQASNNHHTRSLALSEREEQELRPFMNLHNNRLGRLVSNWFIVIVTSLYYRARFEFCLSLLHEFWDYRTNYFFEERINLT